MKYSILLKLVLGFLFFKNVAFAQVKTNNLFANNKQIPSSLATYLKKAEVITFNKEASKILLQAKLNKLELSFEFENKEWILELEQTNIFSKNFFVTTSTNPTDKFSYANECLHYRGKIKGIKKSFAAVSIMADKVVAVLSDESGNINIGEINTPEAKQNNEHIIYRESDLLIKNEFECKTEDVVSNSNNPIPIYNATASTSATINAEPVDIYFEADYQTYLNNSSNVTNVVNYVTALFNVVHVMYENDSVNTQISSIKVWNTVDPYNALTTSSTVLNAFASNMNNGFPGDLAHFLSQRGLGGGVAYLNVICNANYYKTAVSGNLSNSFALFPTYSWSVMVITHELGHNLGSPHTQWCGWIHSNGTTGPIDNCYAVEGVCSPGPPPINGGTVMSYCHLNVGTNLANGFGLLPSAKIKGIILANISCIKPGVYFETTSHSVSEETADVTNGCLPYKLVTTKLKIPYAPTQPVDITLLPIASGGLIVGTNKDIEITPSTFTLDAANLSQTITFKIYNDAIIENLETLSLNFDTSANGGNAVKRNISTTDIVNITSEDHRPDSTTNQLLFYEPFDAIVSGLGSWTQTIMYGAASPNRWIVANNGGADFPTKAAYVSNNGSVLAYSGSTINDSCIIRLESPTINATGFTNMKLTHLLKCVGEYLNTGGGQGGPGGGGSFVDVGKILYSIDNGINWSILNVDYSIGNFFQKTLFEIPLPSSANNISQLKIAFEWRNNSSIVNNPPFIIDSIVIKGTSTGTIQSAAHASNSDDEYLGPNQTIYYYNPVTKNVMATIENNSAFDFGCTKIELIRTGAGATQAWGILSSDKISNKVFKITTTNTNPSAAYKLTLYCTDAEINGWLGATGNSASDIKIVKTNGDITLAIPISSPEFSTINSKTAFGATAHSQVSASFTGLANISTYALMKPYGAPQCPAATTNFATTIVGTNYQWQVNNGSGYLNINNDAVYSNVTSNTISITNPPLGLFTNNYRCEITTTSGIVYSQAFTLKYSMTWLGTTSNAWENPLNWSCNMLPTEKTDVVINSGTPFSPELNVSTNIRTLTSLPASNLVIKTGAFLLVNH
jgi:Metallo-peptidase family M12/Reprolysin family propeptide